MKIGFLGALTLILITLKLLGHISISWVLVVAPLAVPLAVLIFGVALAGLLTGLLELTGK